MTMIGSGTRSPFQAADRAFPSTPPAIKPAASRETTERSREESRAPPTSPIESASQPGLRARALFPAVIGGAGPPRPALVRVGAAPRAACDLVWKHVATTPQWAYHA